MPGETLKVRKPYVISIIDDDPLVREGIARLVRSLGHRSNVFSSAEEYLDAGGVDECNCLITDLHMPGMNGAELREHLVAAGNRVPVIFITSYFDKRSALAYCKLEPLDFCASHSATKVLLTVLIRR